MNDAQILRYSHTLKQYQLVRGRDADRYWQSMLLLCTTTFSLWQKVEPVLDIQRGHARFEQLREKECLSSSEVALLSLARNLYNQSVPVNMAALMDILDDDNWPVVLEALAIYRGEK